MQDIPSESVDQKMSWDRFYAGNRRPWRGVGKIPDMGSVKGLKALDIGCGNGKTVSALLAQGMDVTGVDFSSEAVDYCKSYFGDKAHFVVSDCSVLPFGDSMFDVITMVHILEHLDDIQLSRAVSEVERILVPGGMVFVRVFAIGDMRSMGNRYKTKGNGIRYRYYGMGEVLQAFSSMEEVSSELLEEKMRFGGVRMRLECLFRKES